jgi:hypothetical protein
MTTRRLAENNGLLGVAWPTWIVFGFAVAWCGAFYLMRQPPSPWAFDLPQAQIASKPINVWQMMYPATVVNCGAAGFSWCANYCDQQSRIRYIECVTP